MTLIDNLIQEGWLRTPAIIEAFRKIKRKDFIPEEMRNLAELNEALPIGFGQTISQPLVVAFMLEQLQPEIGDKILDIGSGSGWTTALLAEIVGPNGKVIAIELIPELKEFGERNIVKYNFIEKGIAGCICADGSKGYEKEAPFDKILASASAESIPKIWKKQLKVGGRIVAPITRASAKREGERSSSPGSSIWLFVKKSEKEFLEDEYPGFAFVPLVKE